MHAESVSGRLYQEVPLRQRAPAAEGLPDDSVTPGSSRRNREPSNSYCTWQHCHECTRPHGLFDARPKPLEEVGKSVPFQAFDPNSDRRRQRHSAHRDERVKIRVERNADTPLVSRVVQNLFVGCPGESYISCMCDIPTSSGKDLRCRPWQSLVEDKPSQTGSSGSTSSAKLLAAKPSAWRISSSSSSGYSARKSDQFGYTVNASRTRLTVSRMPRMHGCPFMIAGSLVIRSNWFMVCSRFRAPRLCLWGRDSSLFYSDRSLTVT